MGKTLCDFKRRSEARCSVRGINTFVIPSFHPRHKERERQRGVYAGRRMDRNGRENEEENTRGRENRIRMSKERNACGSHCLLR